MKNRLNTEIEIKDYDKYREIPITNVIAIIKIYNVKTKNCACSFEKKLLITFFVKIKPHQNTKNHDAKQHQSLIL